MLPCLNAAELFILSHTEQDMMTHYSCDLLFFRHICLIRLSFSFCINESNSEIITERFSTLFSSYS